MPRKNPKTAILIAEYVAMPRFSRFFLGYLIISVGYITFKKGDIVSNCNKNIIIAYFTILMVKLKLINN